MFKDIFKGIKHDQLMWKSQVKIEHLNKYLQHE